MKDVFIVWFNGKNHPGPPQRSILGCFKNIETALAMIQLGKYFTGFPVGMDKIKDYMSRDYDVIFRIKCGRYEIEKHPLL